VVHRPPLLLADEPTGNLDPALSREIMDLFVQFNRVGVTVIVATHDVTLTEAFGVPTLALSGGRLARDEVAGGVVGALG
jgi:cell division transport system ATP-binding protein